MNRIGWFLDFFAVMYYLSPFNKRLHGLTIHFPFLSAFFTRAPFVCKETSERWSRKRAKKQHQTAIDKQFTVQPTVKASFDDVVQGLTNERIRLTLIITRVLFKLRRPVKFAEIRCLVVLGALATQSK